MSHLKCFVQLPARPDYVGGRPFEGLVKGFPETETAVPPKTVSGKIWDKVKPLLRVMEGCAKYDGNELITALGTVLVPGCADDASIL